MGERGERDRKMLRDQYVQAQNWLARAAAESAGKPNRNCSAHEPLSDMSRAIAHGMSLLLSDRVAAIDSLAVEPKRKRVAASLIFQGLCAVSTVAAAIATWLTVLGGAR